MFVGANIFLGRGHVVVPPPRVSAGISPCESPLHSPCSPPSHLSKFHHNPRSPGGLGPDLAPTYATLAAQNYLQNGLVLPAQGPPTRLVQRGREWKEQQGICLPVFVDISETNISPTFCGFSFPPKFVKQGDRPQGIS